MLGDADLIREQAEAMGVGRYYPLLAAMLTARPWTDIMASDDPASLAERGTAEDKAQIAGYAAQYARQIGLVLDKVPRPMLLLFKTNDCLRHAERQLGGGAAGASSLLITLRYCLEAMLRDRRAPGPAMATGGSGGGRRRVGEARRRGCGAWRAWLSQLKLQLAIWLLRVSSESAALPRAAPPRGPAVLEHTNC